MSLITVISPAKRLDFSGEKPNLPLSEPRFTRESRALIKYARAWSAEEIARRMDLSDDLANLNYKRYRSFKLRGDGGDRQAALLAFQGDVYQGLDAGSLTNEQILEANDTIRILSGLYGVLRPLDSIQPYRLEMGISVKTDAGNSLYAYWGKKIARALNVSAKRRGATHLVNLASQEYFKAVDLKGLKLPIVTCAFKELRGGKPTIVSFNAKRARGLMARYILISGAKTIEDLKGFDSEDYLFAEYLSDADTLTFLKQG